MLGHLRRCPASLPLRILSCTNATPSRPLSLLVLRKASPLCTSQLQHRAFHRSSFVAEAVAAARADAQPDAQSEGEVSKSRDAPLTTFKELADHGLVNRRVISTLTTSMRLETMTDVQRLTINEALKGVDVLAQAKTGTGKTIGFLLPIVQNILAEKPALAERHRGRGFQPSDLKAIIISPTRELAEQIAKEAQKVTGSTGIVVQTAVGGTHKNTHLYNLRRLGCHILVGTPGRLKDILSDPRSGVTCPSLNSLVLDEADRLLDMGFWPEIQDIQQYLPRPSEKDRQTLMFSATVPNDIVGLARSVMKPNLHYVRTVQEDETPTIERVTQKLVVVPSLENQLPAVLELCNREIQASREPGNAGRPFKAIVYFNTTMETDLAGQLFLALRFGNFRPDKSSPSSGIDLRRTEVYSIHSRMTQAGRTNAAESFRRSKSGILMSSDVTARGMDFPGVTHVIQVGVPQNPRDTYIHRIGRTARAGQEGQGWLIVNDTDVRDVRRSLRDLPLTRDTSLGTAASLFEDEIVGGPSMAEPAKQYFWTLRDAATSIRFDTFDKAYHAMLNRALNASDKEEFMSQLNRLAKAQWGIDPPGLSHMLTQRLGIHNLQGVNMRSENRRVGAGSRGRAGDRGSQRSDNISWLEGSDRFQMGGNSRDRYAPRDDFPPRYGGQGRDRNSRDGAFSSRGRSDRAGFERRGDGGFGRKFDRGSEGGQRGGFNGRGNSRGRSFD